MHTKIVLEYEERCDIDSNAEDLSSKHEAMPSSNGECHHEEFCEDECSEGDGDHVDELGLKEKEPHQHDHTSCTCIRGQIKRDEETGEYSDLIITV